MKKCTSLFLSFVLILLSLSAFAGCQKNSPDATVKGFMEAVKTMDYEEIAKYCEDGASDSELSSYEDEDAAFLTPVFKSLKYKIVSTETGDGFAAVTLEITTIDVKDVITNLVGEFLMTAFSHLDDDDFDADAYYAEQLEQALSKDDLELLTSTAVLDLIKTEDGRWLVTGLDDNDEFLDAITGGLVSAFSSLF